jgi:hypothetical protein
VMFVEHESDIIEGLSVNGVGWPWEKSINIKRFDSCIPEVLIEFFQVPATKMKKAISLSKRYVT